MKHILSDSTEIWVLHCILIISHGSSGVDVLRDICFLCNDFVFWCISLLIRTRLHQHRQRSGFLSQMMKTARSIPQTFLSHIFSLWCTFFLSLEIFLFSWKSRLVFSLITAVEDTTSYCDQRQPDLSKFCSTLPN